MPIKRVPLGTSKPLPDLAAERLLGGQNGFVDLGKIIMVIPGNYARTNLQAALAEKAPNGLLTPEMMTPGVLLHFGVAGANTPDAIEDELIWYKTAVRAAKSGDFPLLFPNIKDENVVSSPFVRLRFELTAGGFSISDAREHLGSRADELAAIEQLYLEELKNAGFDDRLEVDIRASEETDSFAAYDKIILCGIADMPRLLRKKIENIASRFEDKVEAWIYAGESKLDCFDHTGTAIPEKWSKCAMPIKDFDSCIHRVDSTQEACSKFAQLLEKQSQIVFDDTAVILADPSLFPELRKSIGKWAEKHGGRLELYDPSGVPASTLRLHKLGSALLDFCKQSDDTDNAVKLIKNHDFLFSLARKLDTASDNILRKLDDFLLEVLPAETANITAYFESNSEKHQLCAKVFQELDSILKKYRTTELALFLREFFTETYSCYPGIDNSMFDQVPFSAECNLLRDGLDKLAKYSNVLASGKDMLFELFWKQLGQEKLAPRANADSLAVQGCLELPYLREKNVFFFNVDSTCYPDRIAPTAYLTDSVRSKIGIRSNKETFARAAAHFNALCESTTGDRSLNIIVPKFDSQGAPRIPSPLFFSGNVQLDELVRRSDMFFKEKKSDALPDDKWKSINSAFTLTPALNYNEHPEHPGVPVLSVTDFAQYITNPLDFYFNRIMNMSNCDYLAKEPDNAILGTILHEVFQKLGCTVCRSEEEYNAELQKYLKDIFCARFGKNPSPMLEVVKENISQRLEYAAPELLKMSKADHFIPKECEYTLGGEQKMIPLTFTENGVEKPYVFIKGKIDRIEYSPETNTLRIIDFKSGKIEDITKKATQTEKFTDLQMPLYAILIRKDEHFAKLHPEIDMETVKINCSYLALPKNVSDTRLIPCKWENPEAVLENAEAMVWSIVRELKRWKEQRVSAKGLKKSLYSAILLPDTTSALPGIVFED